MSVNLKALQQMQYISLGGYHKHFEFQCEGLIPPNMSHIYITSFRTFRRQVPETSLYCEERYIHCSEFIGNAVTYFAYGNYKAYYVAEENTHYSWSMADESCRGKSMVLPFFVSRDELDEFIRSLQISYFILFPEAVFIGLKFNKTKVCPNSA